MYTLGSNHVFGFVQARPFFTKKHAILSLSWRKLTSIATVNESIDEISVGAKDGFGNLIHVDKRAYLSSPAVTVTALAHAIWKQVIIPFTDTVIDATCGNGKDSIVLSNLLFNLSSGMPCQISTDSQFTPQLICIDVQKCACDNTFHSLSKHIQDSLIVENYIKILNTSHDPLPRPTQAGSVGLICYNLGYLPGFPDKSSFITQAYSTLASIRDAAMMLRLGGLLSITVYPKSNALEANAVRFFCEGLARISSKEDGEDGSWKDYLDEIPSLVSLENGADLQDTVRVAVQAVASKDSKQSWRVFEHKPLGRSTSPTLITALRIK